MTDADPFRNAQKRVDWHTSHAQRFLGANMVLRPGSGTTRQKRLHRLKREKMNGELDDQGQAQIVEKEKKQYQGLPEDLTPIAGKVGASAAEK